MILNLKEAVLLTGYKKELNLELSLKENPLLESYEVDFYKPTEVFLKIENRAGIATFFAHVNVYYKVKCDRCLAEYDHLLSFDISKDIVTELPGEEDDAILATESFDLDEEIVMNILLEFPTKHLCKEDCRGICPKCGCNRNTEKCNCDERDIDPRLEALKKLF